MTKKRFFLSLLMCITFNLCMAQQSADDKAYTEKVVEMIKVSRAFDSVKELLAVGGAASGLNEKQSSVFADELIALIIKHADELIVPIYKETFTYQDLEDLIAFYQTPLGQKVANPEFTLNATEAMVSGIQKFVGEFEEVINRVKEMK